jgi:O-methyltransferase involved in polyketide biosynthesis
MLSLAIGDRKPLPFAINDRKSFRRKGKMEIALDELTPVQRVSLLALRLRALDARSAAPILDDTVSLEVARGVGLDLDRPKISRIAVQVHAVRARMIDAIIGEFVAEHPRAVVLDLGCGLDTRWHRSALPATVDWYDVDFPAVIRLRERLVPAGTNPIAADLSSPGWLAGLPRDRPAIAVTDGLLALLSAADFIAMTQALTSHFLTGEVVFNAYSRFALRNARRAPATSALSMPIAGEGIDGPHEPETWGARLTLVEERFMAHAPEIALFPSVWKLVARISARSTRLARAADRVVRYRFS